MDGDYEAMVWPGFTLAGTSCHQESVRLLTDLIQPSTLAAHSPCEPGPNSVSGYSDG